MTDMARIGELIKCEECGAEVVRTGKAQRFCPECAKNRKRRQNAAAEKERARRKREEKRAAGGLGAVFQCSDCGTSIVRKSKNHTRCAACAEKYHREQQVERSRAYHRREKERRRAKREAAIQKAETPPVAKDGFTLAEVNEAARNHNMSYGVYVVAWKAGTVAAPVKFPPNRKKRRRKCTGT